MMVDDMSLIGWFHTLFCFVAMAAGALNLVRVKGTPQHRLVGHAYLGAMVVQNVSALFVYEPHAHSAGNLRLDHFGVFHWLALITLIVIAIGYYSASRQARAPWAYLHPAMMVLSYYLLIGGAVNEVFVRILALHPLVARTHGAVIGITHGMAILAAFGVLTYFMGKIAAYREAERSGTLRAVAG